MNMKMQAQLVIRFFAMQNTKKKTKIWTDEVEKQLNI